MTTALKEKPQIKQTENEFALPSAWMNDRDYLDAKKTHEQTKGKIADLEQTISSSEARLGELKGEIDQKELLQELGRVDADEVPKLQAEEVDLEKSRKRARAQLILENENLAKHESQLQAATKRTQIATMIAILQSDIQEFERQRFAAQDFIDRQNDRKALLNFAIGNFPPHTGGGADPNRDRAGLRDWFLYAAEDLVAELRNWIKSRDSELAFYRGRIETLQSELNGLTKTE